MSSFSLETNVAGNFVIDSLGIRSKEPVVIDEENWNSKTGTLTLKSKFSGGNITISNGSVTVSGNGNITCCGGGMTIINGQVFRSGTYNSLQSEDAKFFSKTWNQLGLSSPKLEYLGLEGSGSYEVLIGLDDECELIVSGSGDIDVSGDKTDRVIATVTGSGDISGNITVNRLTATVTGSGDISGFYVVKDFRGTVTGSGDIKVTGSSDCNERKKCTGSGKVSLRRR
jgi:hypothetical protein